MIISSMRVCMYVCMYVLFIRVFISKPVMYVLNSVCSYVNIHV